MGIPPSGMIKRFAYALLRIDVEHLLSLLNGIVVYLLIEIIDCRILIMISLRSGNSIRGDKMTVITLKAPL
jgi:hypothetical protein